MTVSAKRTPDTTPPSGIPTGTRSSKPKSWLDYRYPGYDVEAALIRYARDHYTGDCNQPGNVAKYLIKRTQGESIGAYKERCACADYTNHMAVIVDSLVGMLGNVDGDATRMFNAPGPEGSKEPGPGLGDPQDPSSLMGRLWLNADGQGTSYPNLWKMLGTDLTVAHKGWVLVDTSAAGDAEIRLLPFEAVVNKIEDGEGLAEVLVTEEKDVRVSLQSDPSQATEEQFIKFTREGWSRHKRGEKDTVVDLTGPGDVGTYSFVDPEGKRVLPIFPVSLPMKRHAGWSLAKKANAIFNRESERDNILRVANFPKLNIVGTAEGFKETVDKLNAGSNALHVLPGNQPHGYIAPDSGPAAASGLVLESKVQQMYITGFREYGDSGSPRTATEVRQEVSAGAGAFLQLLKSALDDAEVQALYRVAQIELPANKDAWFVCSVARSDDFLPPDADAVIDKLIGRIFGKDTKVPLGRDARIEAAKQVCQWNGLPVNELQIAAAVDAQGLLEAIALDPTMPIPPQLKARILMKLVAAHGLVDAEEEVADADGNKKKLLALLEEEAVKIAEAKAQADQLLSQSFGGAPGKGPSEPVGDPQADDPAAAE